MKKNTFGLIMAGGQGTRFWPYSTEEVPKQFLNIVGQKPLILQTYNRLKAFIRPDNIYIVADKKYLELTRKSIPEFPVSNFIAEPSPKNTAPCLILANIVLSRIDENANMLVVPADHYIPDTDMFKTQMVDALEFADQRWMITSGIKPNVAHIGYGYINFNLSRSVQLNQTRFFDVEAFKEKPKLPLARKYVSQGNYYWNSGMFVYKLKFFKEFLEEYALDYSRVYNELEKSFHQPGKFRNVFNAIRPDSIDFVLMEKIKEVRMFQAAFSWSDVGAWSSVYELNPKDNLGNVKIGSHVAIGSHNCLLFSTEDKPIAAIGIDNLVVINTRNGILVAPMDQLQQVKKVIGRLK
jgi:mannose-1-phosphate guanylyltransferase